MSLVKDKYTTTIVVSSLTYRLWPEYIFSGIWFYHIMVYVDTYFDFVVLL